MAPTTIPVDEDHRDWTNPESVETTAYAGADIPEAPGLTVTAVTPVRILVPGSQMKVHDFVIPTSGMITTGDADADPKLFGFVGADPDDNPETVDLYITAGAEGYRGEGSRSRGIESQGDAGQEVQVAAALGGASLSMSTMGLGYIDMTSYESDGSLTAPSKLFFNYSNLSQEPNLRVRDSDIKMPGTATIKYNVTNPIGYSEDEENALIAKFGYDPTLGSDESGYTSKLKDAFDRSTNKIVESLITTYPTKLATFPRTPAMRIRKNDIAEIPEAELAEGASPAGTTAFESVLTTTTTTTTPVGTEMPTTTTTTAITSGGSNESY